MVVWLVVPLPVTVRVYVPCAAPAPTWTVSVEELPDCTEEGLSVAVTPAGAPETDRATVWAAPLTVAVFTVEVTLPPGPAEPAAGEALIEKS
ncbi:hypothetical protein GCM10020254_18170 [Streptomyces goshikiensis]